MELFQPMKNFCLVPRWTLRLSCNCSAACSFCVFTKRFYGAYSNRARISVAPQEGESMGLPPTRVPDHDDLDCSKEARRTWARLIKKIF
jgi:hypothetical protein